MIFAKFFPLACWVLFLAGCANTPPQREAPDHAASRHAGPALFPDRPETGVAPPLQSPWYGLGSSY